MSDGKPRKPADPLYQLMREGRGEEFNRRRKAGEKCDLRGSDMRGLDLREIDVKDVDFSDCYFRQTDLRGLDLRTCRMEGASLHAAHVSGGEVVQDALPERLLPIGKRFQARIHLADRFVSQFEKIGIEKRQVMIRFRLPSHVPARHLSH